MKYSWVTAALLSLLPLHVAAEDQPPARTFLQEVNGSFVSCPRLLGEEELNKRLYGRAAPSNAGAIGDCANDGRARLRAAYDAYVASNPGAEAKSSAKSLYAASLAYGDAVINATSRRDLDNGIAQAELSKAKSIFIIDSGL
ncbi:hypothetical protein X12_001593 [Xanthomonas arboricola]|uniref:Secreted protein n=1 Tax=Xanthomonas hortorum pv. vitians TaxID=83224 RepID=A0A6V7EQF5_9XANT|nr:MULTISPECIES: hypothetical protein [Xanthomonas]APP85442.1 hypothetical protein BI317_15950 [Xanthomonas hortorum pv. gardneri]MCE4302941.1 hypothetical protein [Xanthomonas hortorum pv. vitians]MCE4311063.1 hypothetical protein [Xanthomonas hortorum pv. vitians]MCE4552636.1 hypothetical protein [Xanthomonas hortorum pv. vitians]MDT7825264.1 hypothetical protein [Xanthomonas hortorum pv. vitians]